MWKSENIKITVAILIAVALISFTPRMIGLDRQVRPDEMLWVMRAKNFVKSLLYLNPAESVTTSHPGVTTMWLASIGMTVKEIINPDENWFRYLFSARLPIAMAISFTILAVFFFVRKIFDSQTAVFSLLFLAFDPFLLGYSKIVHLDALLSILMCGTLLSFMIFKIDGNRKYLYLSGIMGGFAILAKLPALFLLPFIGCLIFYSFQSYSAPDYEVKSLFKNYVIWIFIVFSVIFIFTPRMWVDPFMFISFINEGPGLAAHEYGSFFMGHSIENPGMLFYPIVVLYRVPLITLICFFLFVVLAIKQWVKTKSLSVHDKIALIFTVFVVSFIIFMSIPGKKMERYILPVFPFLSIIAGYGLSRFINQTRLLSKNLLVSKKTVPILYLCVALVGIFQLVKLHPYPTTYFNPVFGGGKAAQRILSIAWGEGIEESAMYLNEKENSQQLVVGCDFHYLLDKYFNGKTVPLKFDAYEPGTIHQLDFLVVTLDAMQKGNLRLPEEILEYCSNHQPIYTIDFNGITYVTIFEVQKS